MSRWPTHLALLGLALLGCGRSPAGPTSAPAPAPASPADVTDPARAPRPVEILLGAPTGDLAAEVRRETARAAAERRPLLVYVGAAWCEPCRRFHDAALAGALDARLGGLRLLEYDLDRDGERLAAAGYRSDMIPLFAVPGADGRASGRAVAGAVKGPGAVAFLTPKLLDLLGVSEGSGIDR